MPDASQIYLQLWLDSRAQAQQTLRLQAVTSLAIIALSVGALIAAAAFAAAGPVGSLVILLGILGTGLTLVGSRQHRLHLLVAKGAAEQLDESVEGLKLVHAHDWANFRTNLASQGVTSPGPWWLVGHLMFVLAGMILIASASG